MSLVEEFLVQHWKTFVEFKNAMLLLNEIANSTPETEAPKLVCREQPLTPTKPKNKTINKLLNFTFAQFTIQQFPYS